MSANIRATQVWNSNEDEEQISEVMTELQSSKNVNAFFVLSKFIDCKFIKEEPEFCEILFNEHPEVVLELIEWMLIPKYVIKKKKIKTNVDAYPYQCKEFMKDNWCFYEQMYLSSRNKKFDLSFWFNFIREEFIDHDTIYTALGYFADVMIPFAKYEFSGSFNLTKSLEVSKDDPETLTIMKILPQTLIDELIHYSYYDPIYQFLKTSIFISVDDPKDYENSQQTFIKIMESAKIPNIFHKFESLTPELNKDLTNKIAFIENISAVLKEIIPNIEPNTEFALRFGVLISSVVETNLIKYCVDELLKSKFCGYKEKEKEKLSLSETICPNIQLSPNSPRSMNIGSFIKENNFPKGCLLSQLDDSDEEELVETFFKILASLIEIYIRIPKALDEVEFHHKSEETEDPSNKINLKSHEKKRYSFIEYKEMLLDYREQMQYILENMEYLTKFVYEETDSLKETTFSKIIPFSSGENIKSISLMKFAFFKLLHNCLTLVYQKELCINVENKPKIENKEISRISPEKYSTQNEETKKIIEDSINEQETPKIRKKASLKHAKSIFLLPFEFKIEKLNIINIIKKYLNNNRWNNLAHHILEKICHLLILGNYEYIKKNIEKDKIKKFQESFLAFLIENFTKRDFIFLNTMNFTTQGEFFHYLGNLHSLYRISKDLAYTLNNTNQLVIFLNEFEPWKKFIISDLKIYEEKTFPINIKPEEDTNVTNEKIINLKVDEADSIKKLIENIETTKKWPTKLTNRFISKSVVSLRTPDEAFIKSETSEHLLRKKTNHRSSIEKYIISEPRKNLFQNKIDENENTLENIFENKRGVSRKGSDGKDFENEDNISEIIQTNNNNIKKETKSLILEPVDEDEENNHEIEMTRNNSNPHLDQ